MQKKDIKLFGEYAARRGKYGKCFRVIVLHPEPIWDNRYTYAWPDYTRAEDNYLTSSRGRYGGKDWACAIEVDKREFFVNDPETGEPWTDLDWHDQHAGPNREAGKWLTTGTRWLPIAVRSANIIRTWAEELEIRRLKEIEEERQRILVEETRRVRQIQEAEQRAQREAEEEEFQKAKKLYEGQQIEFYETRIEPLLVELGIEHQRHISYWRHSNLSGTGKEEARISLTLEQMHKLLDRLTS
jgi:hypothetical protein